MKIREKLKALEEDYLDIWEGGRVTEDLATTL